MLLEEELGREDCAREEYEALAADTSPDLDCSETRAEAALRGAGSEVILLRRSFKTSARIVAPKTWPWWQSLAMVSQLGHAVGTWYAVVTTWSRCRNHLVMLS